MRNHLTLSRIEENSGSIHTTDSSSLSGSIGKGGRREWTMRCTAVILESCGICGHRRLIITEKETDGMESVPEQNRLRSFDVVLVVRVESQL